MHGIHLSTGRRKEIASLVHRKYRERLGQFLVEGLRSIEAAADSGAPLVDLVVSEAVGDDERVRLLIQRIDVPVYRVSAREMERLSDVEASQGVLGVVRMEPAGEESLDASPAILALDGVQDPGNAGTLIRTAAWFGAGAVVAGPGSVDLYNPKVVRAAMGGLWDVRLSRADDLGRLLGRLREKGFAIYGADLEGTSSRGWAPRRPSVLVLGSEAHGLSPAVVAEIDERVAIPGSGGRRGTESLNVAVAAGVLMYEWMG